MRRMILYIVLCIAVIAGALWAAGVFSPAATAGLNRYGIIALAAGIGLTAVVAIGLMALIFYSNRSGRDEEANRHEWPDDELH